MGSRGTTLLDRQVSDPLDTNGGVIHPRLGSHITPGLRLKLLSELRKTQCAIPLSSSGRNFNQFPPGGGLNPRPTPPCRLPQVYFHPSQLSYANCVNNYLQNDFSVNTLFPEPGFQSSRFRKWGNRMTSRILGLSVRSMVKRSIPIPKPPFGGMP
jgi:hypothetical protein